MRDKVIEVSNLQKSYGSRQAVQGVSFKVEQGEISGHRVIAATPAAFARVRRNDFHRGRSIYEKPY